MVATLLPLAATPRRCVAAAFDWQGVVAPKNFRLDAWVSPPTYTLKPPVILPGIRPGEVQQAMPSAIAVPTGSVLVVRASGNVNLDVAVSGGLAPTNLNASPQLPPGAEERRFVIKESGAANVRGVVGHDIAWAFNAVPDRAPTIELTKDPERRRHGGALGHLRSTMTTASSTPTQVRTEAAIDCGQRSARPLYVTPDTALLRGAAAHAQRGAIRPSRTQ